MSKKKIQTRRKTNMLEDGSVRIQHFVTSKGNITAQEEIAASFRKEIQFDKWGKNKIKKVFTREYIDDLLRRAASNRTIHTQEVREI